MDLIRKMDLMKKMRKTSKLRRSMRPCDASGSAKNSPLIYSSRAITLMCWYGVILAAFLSATVSAATLVTLNGQEIIYRGDLTNEANLRLFSLYESATTKPTLLNIRSPGGPIDVGLDLGEWTHANSINIRIDEFCFSSCANYVFTAGNKKYLAKHAMVGFHGGASSNNFNREKIQAALAQFPAAERDKVRVDIERQLTIYLETNRKREKRFYQTINVSQKITTLGHAKIYHVYQPSEFRGWYYSIEDMQKLGLTNLELVDGSWTPEALEDKYNVFRVSLENF